MTSSLVLAKLRTLDELNKEIHQEINRINKFREHQQCTSTNIRSINGHSLPMPDVICSSLRKFVLTYVVLPIIFLNKNKKKF